MRVDGVGLAAVAGGEDSHLRGEFGGNVDDEFPVVDQAVGEVAADAVAALDCPDPIGESFCSGEHLLISGGVGGVSAGGQDTTGGVDGFDGGRAFVWIHSDDDGHRCGLPWSADLWCPCRGGHC